MSKSVFSNAQLRHVYAAQTQDRGRNAKNTARFIGQVFYSYTTPVALILSESLALVSSVSYSNTTARHIPGERDLAPRRVFRVPYLPGLSGGRYETPPGGRVDVAACHAGNLAYLADEARGYVARAVRRALRGNEAEADWRAAHGAGHVAHLEREATDYAETFGLPTPGFAPGHGAPEVLAALETWRQREADPAAQRKREAGRRQRAARGAWIKGDAAPILAEAGLSADYYYDRRAVAEAVKGVPSTKAGLAMLRERLAPRIAREAEHRAAQARMEAERAEREARERAEETARAAQHGYTLAEWRAMFAVIWEAEHEDRERDSAMGAAHWRAVWQAGGAVPRHVYVVGWQESEAGGDMLRVKPGAPDVLESPRGAEVPLSHARRVWRHVLAIMCAGGEWSGEMRVGHFNVSRVRGEWMQAGCHRFHRSEMERVARMVGEPVTCDDINANKES